MPESQGGCLAVASSLESCFGVGSSVAVGLRLFLQ